MAQQRLIHIFVTNNGKQVINNNAYVVNDGALYGVKDKIYEENYFIKHHSTWDNLRPHRETKKIRTNTLRLVIRENINLVLSMREEEDDLF